MNQLFSYANRFFDQLEVFEDIARGHSYKAFMRQAVLEFLENETKENAFAVYTAFFDSYRIALRDQGCTFIDLLDVLHNYEENAATLIDKQRDHYVHSVNVFVLGLCIYAQNHAYRQAFDRTNLDPSTYAHAYSTKHEEFFYRWGIASLFHDIGYPVEIIGKQITKFINLASEVDGDVKINPHLEFDNFEELNSIKEVISKKTFTRAYFEQFESCIYIDLLKPIDLLAHKLHLSLGVELKSTKKALDDFIHVMARYGFIDHGFYSAIIVLKWYGYLIQSCGYKAEYFYFPVLDSASAILLHNYYHNALQKEPFNLGTLSAKDHPIAFLLMLCDELQEWNRKPYGILDRQRNHIHEATFAIDDHRLDVTYLVPQEPFSHCFAEEKEKLFKSLLKLEELFDGGYRIDCEIMNKLTQLAGYDAQEMNTLPRPLLENLEKLAIAIHDRYNQKQLEMHPAQPLEYKKFSELPETLKYSNLRQARSIAKMLAQIGCEMHAKVSGANRIENFADETIEYLAKFEHDEWVRERLQTGWTYGEKKDVEKKISPYLVPYEELSESIKEMDRDTVRHIPELLDSIGMGVFKLAQ